MSFRWRELFMKAADLQIVGAAEWLLQPSKRQSWGGAFNGQPQRLRFFSELLVRFRPEAIVETGTFRGTTTEYMARVSGLPVWSVEMSPRHLGFARTHLRRQREVRLRLGDSPKFLRELLRGDEWRGRRCFVYLDAHWGPRLPLTEELEAVLGAHAAAVVAIDDFEIPGDPGYGFDDYGPGVRLSEALISGVVCRHSATVFYPAAPSAAEGGARRGMCVLAADREAVSCLLRMTTIAPKELSAIGTQFESTSAGAEGGDGA